MDKGHTYALPFNESVSKQKQNKKHLKIKGGSFRTLVFSSAATLLILVALTIQPLCFEPSVTEAIDNNFASNTITFNSINDTASVSLNVSSPDGSFATSEEDQKASFSISTNNYTGYTLTIKSNSESTALTDGDSKLETISSAVSYDDFSGVGLASKALNNRWGYLPNYYREGEMNVVNDDMYLPAPTTTATILRVTDSANSKNGVENADIYTIGLGVRADYTNPKGVYTFSNNGDGATFVLEYVANPVNYIIEYVDDTDDATVSGLPETQAGNTSDNNINISSDIPTRLGFEFAGWCTVVPVDGTCVDSDDAVGMVYLPGDSYNIDQTISNDLTLHAMWAVIERSVELESSAVEDSEDEDLSLYDAVVALAEKNEENDVLEDDEITEESLVKETYPSYVKIAVNKGEDDSEESYTCWRVVRTTKFKDVRLVYNGIYGATVEGSCENTAEDIWSTMDEEDDEVAVDTSEEETDELEDLDLVTYLTEDEMGLVGIDDNTKTWPVIILGYDTIITGGLGDITDPWTIDKR